MKTINIVLKDQTHDLVAEASILRGKSISNVIDDLLSEYFSIVHKNEH